MNVIVWALLTGIITGGTWVGIVLWSRQRRLAGQQQALLEETHRRLAELDETYRRLAEVEERLDFAERILGEGQDRPPRESGG